MSSAHDWLLMLAWLAVLVYLFISLLEQRMATGMIVLPIVVGLVSASWFVTKEADPLLSDHKGWTMLHVSLLVFGIGGVLIGLVTGVMYLWQHYRLKHRQTMQPGLALPNLERLERMSRLAILISVPLLTFGMVLGVGLVIAKGGESMGGRILHDPLVIGSGVCWMLMTGLFVWLLSSRGEPGRKVAWLTVWSGGFLIMTTIGTQVLTQIMHDKAIHGGPPKQAQSGGLP